VILSSSIDADSSGQMQDSSTVPELRLTTRKPPSRVALTMVLVMLFAVANDDPPTVCCRLLPLCCIIVDGCHLRDPLILSSSAELTQPTARHASARVAARRRVLRPSWAPIVDRFLSRA
jgi:hypothetical protein